MIFFFLFGFFLHKYPCSDLSLFKTFLKNKFVRLIPLYWLALIINYAIFINLGWNISHPDESVIFSKVQHMFVVQFFALQFLAGTQPFPTLWFVGALALFILLYGVVSYLTKDKLLLITTLLLAYIPLDILTNRAILNPSILFYYPMFIAGVFAGFFYSSDNEMRPILRGLPWWVKYCSYSSYAVYLFHYPIYVFLNAVLAHFCASNDILVIVFGIPLSFTIGYLAQRRYDNSVGKWLSLYLSRGANQ